MKILFAHRGMSTLAPENTLAAIKLCKENNIKWFECDVDTLSDGTLILSHDNTLERCTDTCGDVQKLTKKDLDKIDAGSWFSDKYIGERLPTLSEVIEVINQDELNVNLEIKPLSLCDELTNNFIKTFTDAIKNINPSQKIIVSSFDHEILEKFKKENLNIETACLFEEEILSNDTDERMKKCQAKYIHICDKAAKKDVIKKLIKKGYTVNVWTVNNLARANELFNFGVNGIFTDVPQNFPSKYKIK